MKKATSQNPKDEPISETESLLDRANQKQKEYMQETYDREKLQRELREAKGEW